MRLLSQWLNNIVTETIVENFPSLDEETNIYTQKVFRLQEDMTREDTS